MAHILVVDDESNIRMMIRLALAHVGHAVATAGDGYEGLETFGTGESFDLVVLDHRMPGLEGLEVLREIRKRKPDAKVLMVTAFGTIHLASEAIAAGATGFLRKPFTVEVLRGAVAAALSGASGGAKPSATPAHAYDLTTVNGFRLEATGNLLTAKDGGVSHDFAVKAASGNSATCRVSLPAYVVELVYAHADRETMPGAERFWQALCAEALANHLWQNAALPDGNALLVDDLTSGLRHFVDAVLSGGKV